MPTTSTRRHPLAALIRSSIGEPTSLSLMLDSDRSTSSWSSGWTSSKPECPIQSSSERPKMRSADRLPHTMVPSSSTMTIASGRWTKASATKFDESGGRPESSDDAPDSVRVGLVLRMLLGRRRRIRRRHSRPPAVHSQTTGIAQDELLQHRSAPPPRLDTLVLCRPIAAGRRVAIRLHHTACATVDGRRLFVFSSGMTAACPPRVLDVRPAIRRHLCSWMAAPFGHAAQARSSARPWPGTRLGTCRESS